MNRFLKLCVCLILCVGVLSACGGKKDDVPKHLVTPAGVGLAIGDSGTNLKDKLGEPEAYAEAQSCYGMGYDKVYTYAGFEVTTYPTEDGKQEFISVLVLTDDTVKTGDGLQLGMEFSRVTDLYGDEYAERGASRVYTLEGDITLWVDVEADIITKIEYRAP